MGQCCGHEKHKTKSKHALHFFFNAISSFGIRTDCTTITTAGTAHVGDRIPETSVHSYKHTHTHTTSTHMHARTRAARTSTA